MAVGEKFPVVMRSEKAVNNGVATLDENGILVEDQWPEKIKWHSNPNLLDNWYFVGGGSQQGTGQFPINQRGETEYTGELYGYSIDRWYRDVNVAANLTPSGLSLSFPAGGPRFDQNIEKYNLIEGQTYTISILADVSNNNGVGVSLFQTSTGWNSFISYDTGRILVSYTFVAGSTDGENYFNIGGPGQNFTVISAKLELGPVQTLAHQDASGNWVLNDPPPDFALELAKCQRYQLAPFAPGYNQGYFGPLITNGDSTFYGMIFTPTTMRTHPVVENIDLSNLRFWTGKGQYAVTSLGVFGYAHIGVHVEVHIDTQLEAGEIGFVYKVNNDSNPFILSCNL